jgi:hypothetical protein
MHQNNVDKFQVEYHQRIDREFLPYVLLSLAIIQEANSSRGNSKEQAIIEAWIFGTTPARLPFEIVAAWIEYGLSFADIRIDSIRLIYLLTDSSRIESIKIFRWFERQVRQAGG